MIIAHENTKKNSTVLSISHWLIYTKNWYNFSTSSCSWWLNCWNGEETVSPLLLPIFLWYWIQNLEWKNLFEWLSMNGLCIGPIGQKFETFSQLYSRILQLIFLHYFKSLLIKLLLNTFLKIKTFSDLCIIATKTWQFCC